VHPEVGLAANVESLRTPETPMTLGSDAGYITVTRCPLEPTPATTMVPAAHADAIDAASAAQYWGDIPSTSTVLMPARVALFKPAR